MSRPHAVPVFVFLVFLYATSVAHAQHGGHGGGGHSGHSGGHAGHAGAGHGGVSGGGHAAGGDSHAAHDGHDPGHVTGSHAGHHVDGHDVHAESDGHVAPRSAAGTLTTFDRHHTIGTIAGLHDFGAHAGHGAAIGSIGLFGLSRYSYGSFYGAYGFVPGQRLVWAGALRLKVQPADAQVFVDGYYVGIVDDFDGVWQRLKLESGLHHVEIRANGYAPLTFDIEIEWDRTITYRGALTPIP